jgi:Mitochondrial carrier protein.
MAIKMFKEMFTQSIECAGPTPGAGSKGSPAHDLVYYGKCMAGGIFACGLTHTFVCPMDIVNSNMQANSSKFKTMKSSYQALVAESGYKWVKLRVAANFNRVFFAGICKIRLLRTVQRHLRRSCFRDF